MAERTVRQLVEDALREAATLREDVRYCQKNGVGNAAEFREKLEKYAKIEAAVNRLPYRQKVIVLEFYIRGRPWKWISGQIGRSRTHCMAQRDVAIASLGKSFAAAGII